MNLKKKKERGFHYEKILKGMLQTMQKEKRILLQTAKGEGVMEAMQRRTRG